MRWRYAFAALALAGGCSSEESVIQPDTGVAPVIDAGPKDAWRHRRSSARARRDVAADAPAPEDRSAPDAPAVEDVPSPRDLGPPRRLECGALARDEDPMGDYMILGAPSKDAPGGSWSTCDPQPCEATVVRRAPST
ncbi:MAG: hypothetical protein R3A52_18825 [Polyangiales bacterium]